MVGIEIRKPSDAVLSVLIAETGSDGVYSAFFQLSANADYGTYRIFVAVSQTDVKANTSFEVSLSAPPDTTPPVISNVAASAITDTSATIVWATNEPASSQVEYGTSTGYGSTTPLDQTLDVSHAVALSGLTPSTTYHFRVRSSDGAGNSAQSGDYTFTTVVRASSTSTSSTSSTSTSSVFTSYTSTSYVSTSTTSSSSLTSSTSYVATSSASATSTHSTLTSSTSTHYTSYTSASYTSTSIPEFNGGSVLLVALAAVSIMVIASRKRREE
jgi:hypothetical protein